MEKEALEQCKMEQTPKGSHSPWGSPSVTSSPILYPAFSDCEKILLKLHVINLTVIHASVSLANMVTLVPSLFQVGCMCINQCWKRTSLVDTFICESLPCIAALHLLFKKVLCHTEAIWISSSCLSWCPLILFHATGPTNLPGTNQISLKTGTEFSVFQFSGTAWVLRDVCF